MHKLVAVARPHSTSKSFPDSFIPIEWSTVSLLSRSYRGKTGGVLFVTIGNDDKALKITGSPFFDTLATWLGDALNIGTAQTQLHYKLESGKLGLLKDTHAFLLRNKAKLPTDQLPEYCMMLTSSCVLVMEKLEAVSYEDLTPSQRHTMRDRFPSLLYTMGQIFALDILTGNRDRFSYFGSSNMGNIMVDFASKKVIAIDNMMLEYKPIHIDDRLSKIKAVLSDNDRLKETFSQDLGFDLTQKDVEILLTGFNQTLHTFTELDLKTTVFNRFPAELPLEKEFSCTLEYMSALQERLRHG